MLYINLDKKILKVFDTYQEKIYFKREYCKYQNVALG